MLHQLVQVGELVLPNLVHAIRDLDPEVLVAIGRLENYRVMSNLNAQRGKGLVIELSNFQSSI
jgi:hypothetical protein